MKTHQFKITITTGKKSYEPGEAVPVGGKDGVSADEIKAIEGIHGVWAGGDTVKLAAADPGIAAALASANAKISVADAKVEALQTVITAQANVDAASATLAQATDDADALAALEAAETALADAKATAGL
jgi:hypothetical protein